MIELTSAYVIPGRRRQFQSVGEVKGLVSVIIPSYQSKWCVGDAIDSVLAQTYPYYEIIVVDDGSTDGTGDFIQNKYGNKVRIVRQNNCGLASARNSGIEVAQGEFIQFLDADDLILPAKFEKQVEFLNNHPEISSVICDIQEIDVMTQLLIEKPRKSLTTQLFPAIIWKNIIGPVHGPLNRTSVVRVIGGFDEDFRNYCADWEFWMTIAWKNYRFVQIPEVLGIYRRHNESLRKKKVYPNALGDLKVALRAEHYAEINGYSSNWKINDVLRYRYERLTYWAAIEINLKEAYKYLITSFQYVNNKGLFFQWARGVKIICEAYAIKLKNQYPKLAGLTQKARQFWKSK
mgnify:CR=1 FL=1